MASRLLVTKNKNFLVIGVIMLMALLTSARRPRDNLAQSSYLQQRRMLQDDDLQPAASGHYGHGRVHIKVYRGPSDGHHASHGFWVKQPADE